MTDSNQARARRALPPLYFLVALIIEVILGRMPGAPFVADWLRLAGIGVVLVGLLLTVWGSRVFDTAGTTVHPDQQASALVTTGPFRFSRNPMYLGMTMGLFGTALLLGKLIPFVIPFLFASIISRRFIQPEEERLHAQFGEAYAEYTRRVRRWF